MLCFNQKRQVGMINFLIIVLLMLWGCSEQKPIKTPNATETASKPVVVSGNQPETTEFQPLNGSKLFLSQAQFIYEKDDQGKEHPVPGPARLVIFTFQSGKWTEEILEDPDSNVFHKAIWWQPPSGDPGILTIGATKAYLKLWRKSSSGWTAETLWNPTFGGKFDRLRDIEIADVTGDNHEDLVIATHDQGVVAVVEWKDGRYEAHELIRKENTFVHEIEIGDVDGDGINEIFTTPSLPNKLDGTEQPGEIDMFKMKDGQWIAGKVESLEKRHAKEILCVALDSEKKPVLFASLEGEKLGGGTDEGDSTRIRLYRFNGEKAAPQDIASLPGRLCRFLNYGDIDGDGKKELIASTKNSGIWKLSPAAENEEWNKTMIATGTSGFEHATYLSDLNKDGKDEIYVASDDQSELRVYTEQNGIATYSVIGKLKEHTMTFNITVYAGQ